MAKDEGPPKIDAAGINALLNIIQKTSGTPAYKALNEVANLHLAQVCAALEDALRPPVKEEKAKETD
jgi:hypothetical protein